MKLFCFFKAACFILIELIILRRTRDMSWRFANSSRRNPLWPSVLSPYLFTLYTMKLKDQGNIVWSRKEKAMEIPPLQSRITWELTERCSKEVKYKTCISMVSEDSNASRINGISAFIFLIWNSKFQKKLGGIIITSTRLHVDKANQSKENRTEKFTNTIMHNANLFNRKRI